MLTRPVNRRTFIKGGAILAGTLAYASGPIALLAPSRAWALELSSLSKAEGDVLLHLTRLIYPHDTLEDAVYALVVKDLDAAANSDAATKSLLSDGVRRLDGRARGNWLKLDREARFVHVRAIAGEPFFDKVRSTAIVSLYNNDMAWAHFGYEGPSFQKGGYIARGFNDLDWLPAPPSDASPPLR